MLLVNYSAFHQSRAIRPIVEFVEGITLHSHLPTLYVQDILGDRFGGLAMMQPDVIKVQLPNDCKYPRLAPHPVPAVAKAAGIPTVNSFNEELVLVLAHEARHFWQFRERMFESGSLEEEIDAECFGVAALEVWRGRSL